MVIVRIWIAAVLIFVAGWLRADEVVVAVPLSMQPYFLPFKGSGLAYDIILAAFATQGDRVRPLYVSSRQINKLLTSDSRADCVPMVSSGLEHGWTTTERVYLLHDYAITRPGVRLTSFEDLRHRKVLGYPGALWFLGDELRAVLKDNPQYREINNHRAQVRLLLQGSVEVIIVDGLLTSWYLDYLREEGKTDTKVVFHDLFQPVAYDFFCRSSAIAARFSAGMEQLIKDGTLLEIGKRYGAVKLESAIRPRSGQPVNSSGSSMP